ncbi:MAG: hypothetical protein OXC46_05190 [Thaumarchaeota archaeon]|nr:hypothetical protein [Nitrososphaerota archaeon]
MGYSWAGTEYERTDKAGKSWDYNISVGNDPDPGSRHMMFVGLWEN